MQLKVLAFGIVKDIFSSASVDIDLKDTPTVDHLKKILEEKYPSLQQLACYMVAVNNDYASGKDEVKMHDEVAIIPPVSGG